MANAAAALQTRVQSSIFGGGNALKTVSAAHGIFNCSIPEL